MLKPEAKLNPKLFDKDVEMKPTRSGYGYGDGDGDGDGDGLLKAGEENPKVVALHD